MKCLPVYFAGGLKRDDDMIASRISRRSDVRKFFFLNELSHLGTIYLPQANT